jgi:hypothetical protein
LIPEIVHRGVRQACDEKVRLAFKIIVAEREEGERGREGEREKEEGRRRERVNEERKSG